MSASGQLIADKPVATEASDMLLPLPGTAKGLGFLTQNLNDLRLATRNQNKLQTFLQNKTVSDTGEFMVVGGKQPLSRQL